MRLPLAAPLAAMLLAAGCSRAAPEPDPIAAPEADLADLDSPTATDPLVMAALNDPIMIDPVLAASANADALRPPARPASGMLPPPGIATGRRSGTPAAPADLDAAPEPGAARGRAITLAALAGHLPGAAACSRNMRYGAGWAARLGEPLPIHPDARLIDAGGVAAGACRIGAARFHVAIAPDALAGWYRDRARRAGYATRYAADGEIRVLSGRRARDGGSFALYLAPRDGGAAEAELVRHGG